jgi:hypothetical protein
VSRGEYAPPDDRFLAMATAAGLLLGIALLAVILTGG